MARMGFAVRVIKALKRQRAIISVTKIFQSKKVSDLQDV
jgi:hypothetical protein